MTSRRPELRTLSTGHAYPEGPCFAPDGRLFVVELAGGVVARVGPDGREVVAETPGSPNGAVFATDGVLYVCNNGGNWGPNASTSGVAGLGGHPPLIQRLVPGGQLETLLDSIDGRPLNAPNDIALDRAGGLWFTDPAWAPRDAGGSAPANASPPGALGFVRTDGSGARRVHEGMVFPNGLVLTPDESALIVGETGTGRLLHFPILGPGVLGEPTVFAELGADAYPDGMCFDSLGRLLVAGTGSGAIFVVDAAGDLVERLEMEDPDVTNVAFGGSDGRTLIVTQASLGRVSAMNWPVPGLRLPASPTPW